MTAVLIEHAQYTDAITGTLISGGKVYIGTNGADPVATAPSTSIFSDRALTTSIPNPQTTGTDGRALNKIWVDGTYSIQVNSAAGVQKFQDLDAGTASSGLPVLQVSSVSGGDTITGTTGAALSSYTNGQQFVLKTVSLNSGPVTFNFDGVGAKAGVKNNDQPIVEGEFPASQIVIVAYNSTNDNFEWVNQNNKVVQFSEGTAVVAAATIDIWATDGNTIHITGTTTISSFGTAPNIGAGRRLIFDSALTLTDSTNLSLPSSIDYLTRAGEIVEVYADSLTQFDVFPGGRRAGLEFIAKVNLAGESTADFTGFNAEEYDGYELEFGNVIPSVDAVLQVLFSDDGGSTYEVAGYQRSKMFVTAGATETNVSSSAAQIDITGNDGTATTSNSQVGSGGGEDGVSGKLEIHSPDKTKNTGVNWKVSYTSAQGRVVAGWGGGYLETNVASDAVRVSFITGNLESGTITLYGRIRK